MPTRVKELPPTERGKYERKPPADHVKIVKQLRKNPGEWYELRTFGSPQAANTWAKKIRTGKMLAFRDGTYEAVIRGSTVLGRFIGD